ncbi:hypothetical protein NHX12_006240 [Muraenolepis orangiensis]|uniref:Genetic suppressor element-like domain-containing protein n=1 Tax=Muraenolepis orangiensis TaxID=630683 RepID=A0A9Q0IB24_9TELE|nr:hypothetical protein NHX12_006240 [Muraenolepis orangiensis]
MESHYLAELHAMRGQEERTKPERLTPNRPEKTKEAVLPAPKPIPPGLHPSMVPSHHALPGLVSAHGLYLGPGGVGTALSSAIMLQRTNEEERWLARQRKLRQEKEDRQYQVSEFRQQVLEQHLDLGRPDLVVEAHRSLPNHLDPGGRDLLSHLGAPPPLISPKPPMPPREHNPPPTPLWNPVSLIDTSADSRHSHEPSGPTHYDLARLAAGPSGKQEDGARRRDGGGTMDKYLPLRGPPGLPEPSTFLAELEKSTQSFFSQQRASLSLSSQYSDVGGAAKSAAGMKGFPGLQGPGRHNQGPPAVLLGVPGLGSQPLSLTGLSSSGPDTTLIYDEVLQQNRRPVSYYYELDDSYDESDEEEVRGHLRRVSEQPPLKLDDSSEKMDFLGVFSLTTVGRRDELVQQKRRKRRRMLRERSPSPGGPPSAKRAPPPLPPAPPPLSTRFTPEEMDRAPELEDKNPPARSPDDTARAPGQSEDPPVAPPHSPSGRGLPSPGGPHRAATPLGDTLRPKEPLPSAVYPDKSRGPGGEGPPPKRSSNLLGGLQPPHAMQPKEGPAGLNGRSKPWDSFTPEEFAQQFHESVLQSTQKALQKHKGGATGATESSHLQDSSVRYNIPELQCGRWQGIESIFEAYHEYIEEQSVERQVLQSQCRRLEAQNYNLSLTAEQLSHSMGELMSQRQKLALEREKLQAELEHFRKCLTLPQTHWPRGGHYKGYPPR